MRHFGWARQCWPERGNDCSGIAGRMERVESSGVAAGGTPLVGESFKNLFRGEDVFRRKSEFGFKAAEDFFGHAKADAGFKIQAAIEEGIDEGVFLRGEASGTQRRESRTSGGLRSVPGRLEIAEGRFADHECARDQIAKTLVFLGE